MALFGLVALTGQPAPSAVLARMLSGTVNYAVNRRWVFGTACHRSAAGARRCGMPRLAAAVLVLNVVLLEATVVVVGSVAVAKAVTELTLFLGSFVAQRHLVFGRRQPPVVPRRGVGTTSAQLALVPVDLLPEPALPGLQGVDLLRHRTGVLLKQGDPLGQRGLVLAELAVAAQQGDRHTGVAQAPQEPRRAQVVLGVDGGDHRRCGRPRAGCLRARSTAACRCGQPDCWAASAGV